MLWSTANAYGAVFEAKRPLWHNKPHAPGGDDAHVPRVDWCAGPQGEKQGQEKDRKTVFQGLHKAA